MAGQKLSYPQRAVLKGMDRLGAYVTHSATAAEIAAETGRSSDGVARTLRSLISRELAVRAGHDGEKYGYRLTDAGLLQSRQP